MTSIALPKREWSRKEYGRDNYGDYPHLHSDYKYHDDAGERTMLELSWPHWAYLNMWSPGDGRHTWKRDELVDYLVSTRRHTDFFMRSTADPLIPDAEPFHVTHALDGGPDMSDAGLRLLDVKQLKKWVYYLTDAEYKDRVKGLIRDKFSKFVSGSDQNTDNERGWRMYLQPTGTRIRPLPFELPDYVPEVENKRVRKSRPSQDTVKRVLVSLMTGLLDLNNNSDLHLVHRGTTGEPSAVAIEQLVNNIMDISAAR
jgi:hypothetical protein